MSQQSNESETAAIARPGRTRTNFGVIGFAASVAVSLPLLLILFRIHLPQHIVNNISVIYFDCGFFIDLVVLVLCVLGVVQGRRNRWFGIAGIAVLLIWWIGVLF